jgi:hypothetical protein
MALGINMVIALQPIAIVTEMNCRLTLDILNTGRFMTMFYLSVDLENKNLSWVRAGHDPAIVYDPEQVSYVFQAQRQATQHQKKHKRIIGNLEIRRGSAKFLHLQRPQDPLPGDQPHQNQTNGVIDQIDGSQESFGKQLNHQVDRNVGLIGLR